MKRAFNNDSYVKIISINLNSIILSFFCKNVTLFISVNLYIKQSLNK